MQKYQVIKAKSKEKALLKSKWRPGDRAICSRVQAIENSDGTYSILADFERPPESTESILHSIRPRVCPNI